MAKKTLRGQIKECAQVILYWKKRPDEHGAEVSKAMFLKALRSHMKLAGELKEPISPEVLKMVERALA